MTHADERPTNRRVDAGGVVGTTNVEYEGERVVTGQRLMQAASDAFLGWASGDRDESQLRTAASSVPRGRSATATQTLSVSLHFDHDHPLLTRRFLAGT